MFPFYIIFPLGFGFLLYVLLIDMQRNPEEYIEFKLSWQFMMAVETLALIMMMLGLAPLAAWYAGR